MTAVATTRPPIWRDVRVLRVAAQVFVVVLVLLGIRWLLSNLVNNLSDAGIDTSFDFLGGQAGFTVADTDFQRSDSALDLFFLGAKNTILSALAGIGIALILGTLIGIGRLSSNWLVAKLAAFYVETLRNIPPLVIIIFLNAALFRGLSPLREASTYQVPGLGENGFLMSNSLWGIPSVVGDGNVARFFGILGFAMMVGMVLWVWRTTAERNTGQPSHRVIISFGLVAAVALLVIVADDPFTVSFPSLEGNQVNGGFTFTTAYAAVTLALGVYTASHIAEIIRGSILAVHKGQFEAGEALALSGFQRYRFVILPQAFRIAIPAIINQFLNLTKNTSLAAAIAYPELTNLSKSLIGNGAPAPQSIAILMLFYLSFSLTISVLVNLVNRRFQVAGQS